MVQPQHLHIVSFIIIIIITIILLLLLLLLLLLFQKVILSFCSFESKKSVVVDVVIAAKHL